MQSLLLLQIIFMPMVCGNLVHERFIITDECNVGEITERILEGKTSEVRLGRKNSYYHKKLIQNNPTLFHSFETKTNLNGNRF